MDKTVAGVIGLMTAMAAGAVQAAPSSYEAAMQAHSYADLLRPIPNATALLREAPPENGVSPGDAPGEARVIPAQIIIGVPGFRHHHHHHHHGYWRRRYWHHHHHHFRRYGY